MTDAPASIAAEAADPATPQSRLAEIAQTHPSLQAVIAANPSCYDGLRDWIETVGDDAARQAVAAARAGNAAPAAAAPVNPFAQPAPASTSPFVAAAAPRAAKAPGSRKPLIIGLAAVLVVLLVGGGVAIALFSSKFGGSSSPEAAVQKALDAVKTMDPVALYGSLSPAELGSFSSAIDNLKGAAIQDDDEEQTDYAALLQEVAAVTEITIDDLEYDVEEVGDGVAMVTITDGTFEMDTDTEVMARALSQVQAESYRANQDNYGYSDSDIDDLIDDNAEYLEDSLDDAMPIEFDADDIEDNWGFELSLVAVQEGGSWYLSPILSYLEFMRDQRNSYDDSWDLGEIPDASDVAQFETPEDAVAGLLDGGQSVIDDGDFDELVAALPLAERRAVGLYASGIDLDIPSDWFAKWDDLELTVDRSGDQALVDIDSLSVTVGDSEQSTEITFEGVCAEWERSGYYSDSSEGCLDDQNVLDELGIGDARIVVVQENGSWFVSSLQTGGYISSIMAARFAELARDGDLDKLSN